MTRGLGSCKYGAECGMTLACECDCCLDIHECECDEDDYADERDDFDRNSCPGCGGNCQTACR